MPSYHKKHRHSSSSGSQNRSNNKKKREESPTKPIEIFFRGKKDRRRHSSSSSSPKPKKIKHYNHEPTHRYSRKDHHNNKQDTYHRHHQKTHPQTAQLQKPHQQKNNQHEKTIQSQKLTQPQRTQATQPQRIMQAQKIIQNQKSIQHQKVYRFPPPFNPPTTAVIKRPSPPKAIEQPIPPKQKVFNILTTAKINLIFKPPAINFLILDSFRTMSKFQCQTIDPLWLSSLANHLQDIQGQKSKVMKQLKQTKDINGLPQNKQAPKGQKAYMFCKRQISQSELNLRSSLDEMRQSVSMVNQLFRRVNFLEDFDR